ncbi:EamA-like transporter family protein [Belnapia rosea]|uniref:EamA-like transporter family protein n=2 Tax=Belnapia rosea TaxID=938405 RepID=A0A1G6XPV8_9PROT|nr:EamA-like transporter family protein [Belnapia rosea]SDD79346.1 EamA-like transporter family protein [Belnapia rosea]
MLRAMPDQPSRAVVAAGVLAMFLFSANFAATGHALAVGLSVPDLVLIRYGVAGPLFLALLVRIGLGGLSLGRAAVLAALAGAPYFLLTAAALRFAPAVHASILNPGGTMVFAPLLAWWLLRTPPETGVRIGLPVIVVGLLLIGWAGLGEGGRQAWIGDLLVLMSGFNWALYGVLMRRWQVSGLRAAAIIGAFSLAWVPVHLLIFGIGGVVAHPAEALGQAIYQGLIAGGLAIILYSRAVVAMGPARAALLPPLVPALGVLWAWLLLGEHVSAMQVAGMVTVVAGMLCGALWRRDR